MQDIETVRNNFKKQLSQVKSLKELREVNLKFLGKKGLVADLFNEFRKLPPEKKKISGTSLNQTKLDIINSIEEKKEILELQELEQKLQTEKIDITLPVRKSEQGSVHILSKVNKEITSILKNIGFTEANGPEIENEFYNFEALNIPKNHPARQMQDSFYLDSKKMVLRTHTSSVQIRKMSNSKPPFRIMSLGKVYRNDHDQTHTPMFHQVEGLVVEKKINIGHLKWTLEYFLKNFFESSNIKTRFRPSFFPFTEPSAELDINYKKENNKIKLSSDGDFMEILGCGMVHPQVLKNVNVNPNEYRGFAFGIGIERLAMLKYGINDLRNFFESDLRFLQYYSNI